MNRRLRRVVAAIAIALQALVPVAAGAKAMPGIGVGDICSVNSIRADGEGRATGLPRDRTGEHRLSHCAACPGSAAGAAILPPASSTALPPAAAMDAKALPAGGGFVVAPAWLPEARGPPAVS